MLDKERIFSFGLKVVDLKKKNENAFPPCAILSHLSKVVTISKFNYQPIFELESSLAKYKTLQLFGHIRNKKGKIVMSI